MYQIPWIGRLKFNDLRGRSWCLRHEANDPGLTLVGPGGEPMQVSHKKDLPVLELLVHHSLGKIVAARAGLLNVQIYDIIWGKAERGSVARTNVYHKTSSDNVVRIITRLRALLGGDDNFESIDYGYKFLGASVLSDK